MKINDIKQSAKLKLSGNYLKCASSSLLYFIIISLITVAQTKFANEVENSFLLAIVQAILILFHWILSYGIIANILDLTDEKTSSITEFINVVFRSYVKYTKIGLRFLLKILFPIILNILAAFYWIGTAIAKVNHVNFLCFNQKLIPLASCVWILAGLILLYYILRYILIAYIYHENPDMNEKEIIDKSHKLMHKNKLRFLLLLLSFLHWFLLAALLLMILNIFIEAKYLTPFMIFFYSIVRPYVIVSKSEFYKELDDVKVEKTKKKEIPKKEA